eukprot:TRINITY_DN1214_c1_g1_i1.p1 TRINITY_DN1214_c1_g1~~TRINITY_DN1214_c1_g1_i1.p1  ORF type:complete len:606 (-),score=117.08 TRINITY_DN1214_c1_g1_i1:401-2218(-)
MEIVRNYLALAELDEEERQCLFPFLPMVSTVEERAERANALSFTDMYRRIVEREHYHEGEEGEREEEDDKSAEDMTMEVRVPQDKRLRALEFVAKAAEHELDDVDMFDITKYTCSCGKECVKKLSRERFVRLVHSLRLLNGLELRKFITYTLLPLIVYPTDDDIVDVMGEESPTKRRKRSFDVSKRRASVTYVLGRVKMCRTAFTKLVGISGKTLTSIVRHICDYDGAIPQISDERKGTKERHTEKKASVVMFLRRYGEECGYPCPSSHPPGGDIRVEEEIILLPSGTQKFKVYEDYCDAILGVRKTKDDEDMDVVEGDNGDEIILPDSDDEFEWDGDDAMENLVSFSNFLRIWKKECRWIRIAQGASDLCDFCCRYEREKLDGWQVVVTAHKLLGRQERLYYKKLIELSSVERGSLHLTIDYAQCVRVPHEMRQAANIYFASPYKIDLFGIAAEAEGRTDVYCIPEGNHPGKKGPKGANDVIVMLDHYLAQESLKGIRRLYLHADNCAGQNKNRFVFAYLAYLVACGRFDSIIFAFMCVGHTKCAVDGTFGLVKRLFWNTERVETPDEFLDVVNASCGRARAVNMQEELESICRTIRYKTARYT